MSRYGDWYWRSGEGHPTTFDRDEINRAKHYLDCHSVDDCRGQLKCEGIGPKDFRILEEAIAAHERVDKLWRKWNGKDMDNQGEE